MDIQTDTVLADLIAVVSSWGLRLVGALAVLLIGRAVASMVRSGVRRSLAARNVDATLLPFLTGMAYYVVLAAVVIGSLEVVGVKTTGLLAALGAAGLAVGLAMKDTLSNFAAGVMLLIFRPFRVGDFVDVGIATGTVQEIGLFATTLHTGDNVKVIAPNGAISVQTIQNYSANDTRRIDLVVGVDYGDDLQLAIDTVTRVLGSDGRVLADPAPTVAVSELADSSVNLVVRPWCHGGDYWPLRFDLTRKLKEELTAAGCSIPFPQHDLHIVPPQASA